MSNTTTTFIWILVLILSFGIFSDLIPQGFTTVFYGVAWILTLIMTLQGLNTRELLKFKRSSVSLTLGFALLILINVSVSVDSALTLQRLFALVINIIIAYHLSIRTGKDLSLRVIADAFRNVLILTSVLMVVIYVLDKGILIDHGDNSNLNGTFKGLFPMKNVLGRFMVMAILFEFSRKRLNFTIIGLAFFWLIVSKSATAIIAAATLIPIMFTKSLSSNKWPARLLLVSMALILIFFPVFLDLSSVKLILSDYLGKSTDLSGRTALWPYAIKAAAERPWFGYGFSAFWESEDAQQQILQYFSWSPNHSHNGFLQLLIDFGIFGAIPLLLVYLRVSKYAILLYAERINIAFSFCYMLLVFNFSQSELVGRNSFTFIFLTFLFFLSLKKHSKPPLRHKRAPSVNYARPQ